MYLDGKRYEISYLYHQDMHLIGDQYENFIALPIKVDCLMANNRKLHGTPSKKSNLIGKRYEINSISCEKTRKT